MKNEKKSTENKPLSKSAYITLTAVISIFICCFAAGFLLLFVYAIAMTAATKSFMLFFLAFGGSLFSATLAFLLFQLYQKVRISYGKKLLFSAPRAAKPAVPPYPPKERSTAYEIIQNIAFVMLALSVFSLAVSAFYGAFSRSSYVSAFSEYKIANGYFSESKKAVLSFEPENELQIELNTKNAVVIFDENATEIRFEIYNEYENQIRVLTEDGKLILTEDPPPENNGALEKMLFFVFEASANKRQIKIYVPSTLYGVIAIEGNYITAIS